MALMNRMLGILLIITASDVGANELQLVVSEPPEWEERVITTAPTPETVREVVSSLSWGDITFVVLRTDQANWFEVSGALNGHGLSARYSENGTEFVSAGPPRSLREGEALLISYMTDDRWRSAIGWH